MSYTSCNLIPFNGVFTSESNAFLHPFFEYCWHQNNSGVFFPANSVPQLNTRHSPVSTAQEPSADLTPQSAEHWVHFMSIGHEAALGCRRRAQPGNTFPPSKLFGWVFSISLCHSNGNHRQTCCHFLFWCQDSCLLGEEEAKGKRDMRRNNDGY